MEKELKKKKQITKKQLIIIISIVLILVIGGILIYLLSKNEKEENVYIEDDKVVEIDIKEDLNFEINSVITILDLITNKNNLNVENEEENIDTSVLGEKEIVIKYIDNKGKNQEKKVNIKIVDSIAPEIEYIEEIITTVNKNIDLLKDVKVTDNSNEDIKVIVEGEYDIKKVGTYNLKYVAIDSSGNKTEKDFVFKVEKEANNSAISSNKPTTNKKPTTSNNKPNLDDSGYADDKIDYANSVVYLDFGTIGVDSAVIYFGGDGSYYANYFELFVYSEDGNLINTYQVNGTPRGTSDESNSFKLTNLGFRTTYYLHAKSYKVENGNKQFLCQTEGFNDYKRGRNFFTKHDDTIYMNKMFDGINKSSGNKFIRDANLDKATKTCAKKYYDDYRVSGTATVSATDCLAQNGITNVKSARFVHLDYPGKLCVVGTSSCVNGIVFSYVPLEDTLKNYQFKSSYIGNDAHIGVTYYENIAGAIYVSYNGE